MPRRRSGSGRGGGDAGGRPGTLHLRPDRRWAAGWTLAGLGLVTMGAWIVVDSGIAPLAVAALVVFVVVTVFFALQLAAPRLFRVELEPGWLHARVLWRRVRVPWDAVHVARVTRRLGDPWLIVEVRVQRPAPDGEIGGGRPTETDSVGVLLPVGVDLPALRRWLEAWVGRG